MVVDSGGFIRGGVSGCDGESYDDGGGGDGENADDDSDVGSCAISSSSSNGGSSNCWREREGDFIWYCNSWYLG